MPKASVVVPVYNVKDYLEKCVDSILVQTERDFELLLIDDGSTDGSGALCDALAQRDGRIRVVHQENGGPGAARNTGVREAVGTWLLQVDSDDWIDPELLERTIEAGERENADLIIFGIRFVDENGKVLSVFTEPGLPKDIGLSPHEYKELLLTVPGPTKLYRRELFSRVGAEYPVGIWYEDAELFPKLVVSARSVVFLSGAGYNYLLRSGSTMRNSNVDRNGEILLVTDSILDYFREKGLYEEYEEELCYFTFSHLYQAAVRVLREDRRHPLLPKLQSYLTEHFPQYRRNRYMVRISRNQKLVLFLLERKWYLPASLLFRIKS